jgi:hypothetical protein
MTRQARYMRRKRAGLRLLKVVADPVEVADLIRACGLIPVDASPEALAAGIQAVIELWSTGSLRVDRLRESL